MTMPAAIGYQEPNVYIHHAVERYEISNNGLNFAGWCVKILNDPAFAEDLDKVDPAGRVIQESTHLRKLIVSSDGESDNIVPVLSSFFTNLSNNRSIEHLVLKELDHSSLDIFAILAPFFEHNHNLRCVEIHNSYGIADKISSLISSLILSTNLERIDVVNSDDLRDELAETLINAINVSPGLPKLLELCLRGNNIACTGCVSLNLLLKNSNCRIVSLDIRENTIDDTCMFALVDALIPNTTLQSLNLSTNGLTSSGWKIFSAYLSDCSLKKLILERIEINYEASLYLGVSLATNNSLICLRLRTQSITSKAWKRISEGFKVPGSQLVEVDLSRCNIDDDGAMSIMRSFLQNTTLKKLNMARNRNITAAGWATCIHSLMRDTEYPLEELDVSYNNISDLGARMLIQLISTNKSTVRVLNVGGNAITTDVWREFANVLTPNSSSKLRKLCIGCRRNDTEEFIINDDVIVDLAAALCDQSTLEVLVLEDFDVSEIGWSALSNALCDASEIESVCNSNHSLHDITGVVGGSICIMPEVLELLYMNTHMNKGEVIRRKILSFVLNEKETIGNVFSAIMETVLPSALAWIGRDHHGYSSMFDMLRCMPSMIGN